MSACRFLVHDTFRQQYIEFLTQHEEAVDSLHTQLLKSRDDPAAEGRLGSVLNPRLEGLLYKLHVMGREGFRYVYFHEPSVKITLPIFLSMVPRKNFDWDTAPYAEIAEAIVADLDCDNWDKFKQMAL